MSAARLCHSLSYYYHVSFPSQGWLPQKGSVRRILCADPSCDICNDVALEIQQLLEDVRKSTSKTSLGLSRTSSCPNIVSTSSLFLPKAFSFSGKVTTVSHVATKNPVSRINAQSSCAGSIHDIWNANHQPKQEFQVTDLFQDKAIYSSSVPEEPGIPVNQKDKRKSNTKLIQEKKGQQSQIPNFLIFSHHRSILLLAIPFLYLVVVPIPLKPCSF